MAAHGESEIIGVHAKTIVDNPDKRLAAGRRGDFNPVRPGVDGVFDKLLHNTGRPLDDFTGGYLVDQGFWQLMNAHKAMLRDSAPSAMFGGALEAVNLCPTVRAGSSEQAHKVPPRDFPLITLLWLIVA